MKTITRKELDERLGAFVSVKNARSNASGREVANQFIIQFENGEILQSYRSLVAAWIAGMRYFGGDHDYSNTTCRHLKEFCRMDAATRRDMLESETAIYIEDK